MMPARMGRAASGNSISRRRAFVGNPNARVRRVGVLGGSGGGHVSEIPGDVEVLVTGDVSYHDALDARTRGLALVGLVPRVVGLALPVEGDHDAAVAVAAVVHVAN